MKTSVYDSRPCTLGEGPLWHPESQQLFWFDIVGRRLLSREGEQALEWHLEEMTSAAGWVDRETLLLFGETAIVRFDIGSGRTEKIAALEADKPGNRTNDGRADPWGGFWISTMGKNADTGAGAIYRFYDGRIETLFENISIPNAICFSPDRKYGYFADTAAQYVKRVSLDPTTGAPSGEPQMFLDLGRDDLNPDGAVIDAQGNMWLAQWGAGRVAAYSPEGAFLRAVEIGGVQASCPAFGGPDLSTLYCTTAREGLDADALKNSPDSGMVFFASGISRGQAEHRVLTP